MQRYNKFIFFTMVVLQVFVLCSSRALEENECMYTFYVSKQQATTCPPGSVQTTTTSEDDVIDRLSAKVTSQQQQLTILTAMLLEYKEKVEQLELHLAAQEPPNYTSPGTNYVRWGRKVCPETASLIYDGYMATAWYQHSGGGANYICLDKHPKWPPGATSGFQSSGYIHGTEYQSSTTFGYNVVQHDAPCAVCEVSGRGQHLMIPGNLTCPNNWTKEYSGIIMASAISYTKTMYVCVDGKPEFVAHGGSDKNGGLLYAAEAKCGYALPCPPYIDGYEIACVVCTR